MDMAIPRHNACGPEIVAIYEGVFAQEEWARAVKEAGAALRRRIVLSLGHGWRRESLRVVRTVWEPMAGGIYRVCYQVERDPGAGSWRGLRVWTWA